MIQAGDIYYARPEEIDDHKVIVVSREQLNRGNAVVAVLVTSTRFEVRSKLPNNVVFRSGEFGFTKDCVAQGESVSRIPINVLAIEHGPVVRLDDEKMREVIRAIGYAIDAECEPT
jgi:mRNA-degrading endonuclease toxin of MazEF toxin-antitoxin module